MSDKLSPEVEANGCAPHSCPPEWIAPNGACAKCARESAREEIARLREMVNTWETRSRTHQASAQAAEKEIVHWSTAADQLAGMWQSQEQRAQAAEAALEEARASDKESIEMYHRARDRAEKAEADLAEAREHEVVGDMTEEEWQERQQRTEPFKSRGLRAENEQLRADLAACRKERDEARQQLSIEQTARMIDMEANVLEAEGLRAEVERLKKGRK